MSARYLSQFWRLILALLMVNTCQVVATELEKDPLTQLVKAEHWELVRANCITCHSTRGFTQVRQNRKNWEKTIRTMQQKHGLWDLGDMEPKVLDYLEKHYGLPDRPHNPKIRRPLED